MNIFVRKQYLVVIPGTTSFTPTEGGARITATAAIASSPEILTAQDETDLKMAVGNDFEHFGLNYDVSNDELKAHGVDILSHCVANDSTLSNYTAA